MIGATRRATTFALSTLAGLACAPASGHELWFQPAGGKAPAAEVRLTFGDSPAPGEAERVAEIAHARVWGDGAPLEVRRLPYGLEAAIPTPRPSVLSAFADRGVIDYQGDSFVIVLAAYTQAAPIKATATPRLGLDEDQVRLLWVEESDGTSRVRATWRGKPAAGIPVTIFRGSRATEARTDARGEIPLPDPAEGPASLL